MSRSKNVPWPDRYRSIFNPTFSDEEAGFWGVQLLEEYPDLVESEAEQAVELLGKIKSSFKYSPGVNDLKKAIRDVRARKRMADAKGTMPDGCEYCQDTGWMVYPWVMIDGRKRFADPYMRTVERNGEEFRCVDYDEQGVSSCPCFCISGEIHNSTYMSEEALQRSQESIKRWMNSQPEESKYHPQPRIRKATKKDADNRQEMLDLTQGITGKD